MERDELPDRLPQLHPVADLTGRGERRDDRAAEQPRGAGDHDRRPQQRELPAAALVWLEPTQPVQRQRRQAHQYERPAGDGGAAQRQAQRRHHDRTDAHPAGDRLGAQLGGERDQGDQGDHAELVAGAEDPLDRPQRIQPPGDAQEAHRSVQQQARDHLHHQRHREHHAQHVAENPHDLDRVPQQAHRHPEQGEPEQVGEGPRARPLVLAPDHREARPADEHDQRQRQQPVPFDLPPHKQRQHHPQIWAPPRIAVAVARNVVAPRKFPHTGCPDLRVVMTSAAAEVTGP